MGNDTHSLPQAAIQAISARLADLPDLRLPAQLRDAPTAQRKREYLAALMMHDPGVFLERHGSSLTAAERAQFEPLRGDYEVNFYMKMLENGDDERKCAQVSRNRRLAYLNRLDREGQYFSEKEMRDRQPGIYHQYVGQYRPPEVPEAAGEGCQAGTLLADSIMRQHEEVGLRQRAEAEERQWNRAEEAAALAESEEETDSEDEDAAAALQGRQGLGQAGGAQHQRMGGQQGAPPAGAHHQLQPHPDADVGDAAGSGERGAGHGTGLEGQQADEQAGASQPGDGQPGPAGEDEYVRIPPEEQREYAAAFLDLMKQRFLAGQDAGVDYAAIDADAELDEDWAVQEGRDAEDKYFGDE